jgi:thioredoxin reductase
MDADVIIVGGGPAGLSAALVLARACRTVLLFDLGKPRNAATRHMHGFLSRDGITPGEFRKIARADLERYTSVRIQDDAEVVEASCTTGGFRVRLATGRTCQSRKLLIATGVADNLPDVPGLQDFYGQSIFHCPFCDGWELREQPLAVYGKGRRGHGLSLELLGWSHDIVLCTDGPAEIDAQGRDDLARNHILIREERIARLEGRHGQLERIVFDNDDALPRRGLFFTTGQHQASPLAMALGCEFNEKGTVHTGRHETTRVAGLYVAGDASRDVQWVVVAAAEGAEAAFAITQDLIKESWKHLPAPDPA